MAFNVHVSDHAVKRFRYRCSEGAPWSEFSNAELKDWIARMVIENAREARYYRTRGRRSSGLVVPLRDQDALLAIAIVAKSRYPWAAVSVKTVYHPSVERVAGNTESFLPPWWQAWAASITRGA